MNQEWTNILNSLDWKTIIELIVAIVIAFFQYQFSRKLEKQKMEIQKVTERVKHDNQRRLTDFNLFATKKHERFIELYEKLSLAHNQVLWRANPLRGMPVFTDHNREDMIAHLDNYKITGALKEKLLAGWEANSNKGTKEIHDMMISHEDLDTSNSIREAFRAYTKAQLYLSRTLLNEIDNNYLTKVNELAVLLHRESRQGLSREERNDSTNQQIFLQKHIEKTFPELVQKLQYALREDPFDLDKIH